HRRLAIIDLTNDAEQPMHYLGNYSIVFNGEIYNYIELKQELKQFGYSFRTNSDTEVILAAYDYYQDDCVQHFDGMFSFAIWNEKDQTLFAARDRFGEKPFFYNNDKYRFVFASEMKAFWAIGVEKQVSNKMLSNYLITGNVQNASNNAETFYENIFELPAAHILKIKNQELQTIQYWDLQKNNILKDTEENVIQKLEELLHDSVIKRLRSDVPVGMSLSGGLDSSTLLHFVSQHQPKVKTFSAVFPGFEKDESAFIKKAVNQYHVENFSITPNEKDLVDEFEKLIYHQEAPFQSSSIFAQYKVYQLAKENNIKVLLDGQGADEVFGGYLKYIQWYLLEQLRNKKVNTFIAQKRKLEQNFPDFHFGMNHYLASFFPSRAAKVLSIRAEKSSVANGYFTNEFVAFNAGKNYNEKPVVKTLNDILYFNTMQMGLSELLRFADRNSMAHGCEVRLPFLNHQLVSYVFSLPSSLKIHDGFTKYILRKTMQGKLPNEIVWRKEKIGFEPPQNQWMDSTLMQDYLHEAKRNLVNNNILKPEIMHKNFANSEAHEPENLNWRFICASQL
ncbi:MAG: asparagine synthase (glutamine-hydrolyzing), partial [Sphingobacteriales bacterium]|nr:asparagine synthase (glutamine-hydrolyzing) [Sphingobacteriales bacterium]